MGPIQFNASNSTFRSIELKTQKNNPVHIDKDGGIKVGDQKVSPLNVRGFQKGISETDMLRSFYINEVTTVDPKGNSEINLEFKGKLLGGSGRRRPHMDAERLIDDVRNGRGNEVDEELRRIMDQETGTQYVNRRVAEDTPKIIGGSILGTGVIVGACILGGPVVTSVVMWTSVATFAGIVGYAGYAAVELIREDIERSNARQREYNR